MSSSVVFSVAASVVRDRPSSSWNVAMEPESWSGMSELGVRSLFLFTSFLFYTLFLFLARTGKPKTMLHHLNRCNNVCVTFSTILLRRCLKWQNFSTWTRRQEFQRISPPPRGSTRLCVGLDGRLGPLLDAIDVGQRLALLLFAVEGAEVAVAHAVEPGDDLGSILWICFGRN
jgi:hypothetical protein